MTGPGINRIDGPLKGTGRARYSYAADERHDRIIRRARGVLGNRGWAILEDGGLWHTLRAIVCKEAGGCI
jgi:hypothetical protein